jgi:hypothetical protein
MTLVTSEGNEIGRELYRRMRREFDFSQIVWTMLRYNPEMTRERAEELLDAFLQWLALVPSNTENAYVVMFQTPVEEAFHSFVLNTRRYEEFCKRFLGFFFHHDPLIEESGPGVEKLARYTVETLRNEFGDELHPELRRWQAEFTAGTYKIACVGPGGSCHT